MSDLSGLPKVRLEWLMYAANVWFCSPFVFRWTFCFLVSLSFSLSSLVSCFVPSSSSLLGFLLPSPVFFLVWLLCWFLVLVFWFLLLSSFSLVFSFPLSPFFCVDCYMVAFLASNWRTFARGHHGDYGKIPLPYSTFLWGMNHDVWLDFQCGHVLWDQGHLHLHLGNIQATFHGANKYLVPRVHLKLPCLNSLWFLPRNQVCLNSPTCHNPTLLLDLHGNPRGLLWHHLDL